MWASSPTEGLRTNPRFLGRFSTLKIKGRAKNNRKNKKSKREQQKQRKLQKEKGSESNECN